MFVSVVVVLGTEPVMVVRSDGGSCTSGEGAWVMMAGMGAATTKPLRGAPASVLSLRQSVESATERRVVVAGVSVVVGVRSVMGAAWWSGAAAAEAMTAQLWVRAWPWTSGVSGWLGGSGAIIESGML